MTGDQVEAEIDARDRTIRDLRAKLDAATVREEALRRALAMSCSGCDRPHAAIERFQCRNTTPDDLCPACAALVPLDPTSGVALLQAAREFGDAWEATFGHYTNTQAAECAEARLDRAREALLAARRAERGEKP